MGYVIIRDGNRSEITLGGQRTLAEILSHEDYLALKTGTLIAVTSMGGIMDLSSHLEDGEEVTLRPPTEKDLAIFRPDNAT